MENNFKNIQAIIPPPSYHMVGDGFRVHNFFPSQSKIGMMGMSPFILMDYGAKWMVPPSDTPRGVGVHPHRGFETVTIAYHGKVAHHDSAGNSGVISEGDVQWMTAGSGVLHKEYHEKEFSKKGGILQMVQLWVNLPHKYKMTTPKYQTIEKADVVRFLSDDKKSSVEIIAGEYKGKKGSASTFSPVNLFNAKLTKGSKETFSFNNKSNTGMLLIEGEVKVNNSKIAPENHFIFFDHEGENIVLEAINDSVILILNGEPINEPMASYGPFVMNTEAEIKKAYEDFYSGKFGHLED